MFQLIKNIQVYAPENLGRKDILVVGEKIASIQDNLEEFQKIALIIDGTDLIATPGFIDQHIHLIGAGGKDGYASMTPEIKYLDLIKTGTTTVVGLLGTDGNTRNIKSLFAKVKSLEQEGITAYMYSGYYGLNPITITDSIQGDMIFIDKVLGHKIAISDIRSSYPTALDLVRILRDIMVGGMIANKKGILHLHLGNLDTKMDVLFELVKKYQFPIKHISPTHVGRTLALFEQAIEFAKLGGSIDITTGASKYTDPYKTVIYALDQGVSIDNITFSSDGHAGLTKFDENKQAIGITKAPFDQNMAEIVKLINIGGLSISEGIKPMTTSVAKNLGLKLKGHLKAGFDADLCIFDSTLTLQHVMARGKMMLKDQKLTVTETIQ